MTDEAADLPTGVRRVLAATDAWAARDAAEDLLELGEPGDSACELWNDLIDVYEHGEVSTQAAWSVLRAACVQWLVLDETDRRAFEQRTLDRDLDDLLAEQGHRRGPQPDRAVTTPWRGRWDEVRSHVSSVDVTGSPYMAAGGGAAGRGRRARPRRAGRRRPPGRARGADPAVASVAC